MIKPVGSMLVVKKEAKEDKTTASGLVISASFDNSNLAKATIIAIGEGEPSPYTHQLIKVPDFDIGDKILYPTAMGQDVEDGDEIVTVINYKSVLCKVG